MSQTEVYIYYNTVATTNGYIIIFAEEGSALPSPSLTECVFSFPFPALLFYLLWATGLEGMKEVMTCSFICSFPVSSLMNERNWCLKKMGHRLCGHGPMGNWWLSHLVGF